MGILDNYISNTKYDEEKNLIKWTIPQLRDANNELASKKEIELIQSTYEDSEKYYWKLVTPLLKILQNIKVDDDADMQNDINHVLHETEALIQQPILLSPLTRKEEDLLGSIQGLLDSQSLLEDQTEIDTYLDSLDTILDRLEKMKK